VGEEEEEEGDEEEEEEVHLTYCWLCKREGSARGQAHVVDCVRRLRW
jgi:hypothetical protein